MGIQLPLKRGTASPTFRPMSIWPNGWMDQDATWYGGRPRPRPLCDRWGPSPRKGHSSPPLLGSCLLWPNDRPSQLLLSTCYPVGSKLHYGLLRKTSSPRLKQKTTTTEGGIVDTHCLKNLIGHVKIYRRSLRLGSPEPLASLAIRRRYNCRKEAQLKRNLCVCVCVSTERTKYVARDRTIYSSQLYICRPRCIFTCRHFLSLSQNENLERFIEYAVTAETNSVINSRFQQNNYITKISHHCNVDYL